MSLVRRLRIAILVWESIRSIHVGGLGVVATRFAEELAERGHDVHVFTRWVEGQPDRSRIKGVNYCRCKFPPTKDIISFFSTMSRAMLNEFRIVAKHGGKFDIVHGHDWHVVDALYELKKEGYPIVLSYHSTEYGRCGGAFRTDELFKRIYIQEKLGTEIADRVVTVSKTMKGELCEIFGTPPEKIDVIPNAITPEKYRKDVRPGDVKKKYGIPETSPVVLYIGRLEYQKGPDLLLEAAPLVLKNQENVKFVFAGRGTASRSLKRRVRKLGISGAVKFLGWIPYMRYVDLLNTCDLVCIPSRNEPFGIVLLEAWATGRPVVVTDVGGLGENVENFVNGIKVHPHPKSIAQGINYLLNHPRVRERIAREGNKSVKEFNWPAVTKKLLGVYHEVLEKRFPVGV
jgi:glycosyltransferase involved in cell wall biosynthesis